MGKILFAIFISVLLSPRLSVAQDVIISDSAKAAVQTRINLINKEIKEKGYKWKAGVTSISYLTKEEKKTLCGLQKNSNSLQNYKDGQTDTNQIKNLFKTTTEPPNWTSMMGRVKSQGVCGNCWAHASAGAAIGLLHNQYGSNVGIDLDERNISMNAWCSGGECEGTILLNADYGI